MVVTAIIGLVMSGVVYSVHSVAKSELRSSASKLAGGIRYCFDRAITTGSYYRIVLDLDNNKYWAERSDDRTYLTAGKEVTAGKGQAFNVQALEKQRDEDDAKLQEQATSVGGQMVTLDPPPRPKRAKFQTFKDSTLPQVLLTKEPQKPGPHLFDVYTPRQPEPYLKGRAYLYFFPDGHTERAIVRLNRDDDFYSLVVHPLTGRVEVIAGKVDIPRDFGNYDEEGKDITR